MVFKLHDLFCIILVRVGNEKITLKNNVRAIEQIFVLDSVNYNILEQRKQKTCMIVALPWLLKMNLLSPLSLKMYLNKIFHHCEIPSIFKVRLIKRLTWLIYLINFLARGVWCFNLFETVLAVAMTTPKSNPIYSAWTKTNPEKSKFLRLNPQKVYFKFLRLNPQKIYFKFLRLSLQKIYISRVYLKLILFKYW